MIIQSHLKHTPLELWLHCPCDILRFWQQTVVKFMWGRPYWLMQWVSVVIKFNGLFGDSGLMQAQEKLTSFYSIIYHCNFMKPLVINCKLCMWCLLWVISTRTTRTPAFWSCLIRCANMKWIWWVLLKIQSDCVHRWTDGQTDGRTDGQTDGQGETSIPPFQLRWSRGIIKSPHYKRTESHHHEMSLRDS